jgi:hypothetical protein
MATEVATSEGAAATVTPVANRYSPSWIDWLTAALERLPGPTWLAYLGVTLIAAVWLLLEALASSESIQSLFDNPSYVGYIFFFVFPLAAYHYLSLGARSAWLAFRPATSVNDEKSARVQLELSTTPFWPVAAMTLIVAAANILFSFASPESVSLNNQPLAYVALRVVSESLWAATIPIGLAYLIIRQVRLISNIDAHIERVDLLRQAPLHALSRLTARGAIVLVIIAIYVGLPLPGNSEAAWLGAIALVSVPALVLAAIVFVVPLRGISRLLIADKNRRLDEIGDRIDAASAALHGLVAEETAGAREPEASAHVQTRIDALSKALASLLLERDFIRRLSTWPWDPGTLRAVASAIALPIVLFVITRLLERFV